MKNYIKMALAEAILVVSYLLLRSCSNKPEVLGTERLVRLTGVFGDFC